MQKTINKTAYVVCEKCILKTTRYIGVHRKTRENDTEVVYSVESADNHKYLLSCYKKGCPYVFEHIVLQDTVE